MGDVRDTVGNDTRDTVCDTDGIVDLGQNLANRVPAAGLELTDDQRRALVGWLTVIQGGKEMHKKVNVRMGAKPLPPSIACVDVCLKEYCTR